MEKYPENKIKEKRQKKKFEEKKERRRILETLEAFKRAKRPILLTSLR